MKKITLYYVCNCLISVFLTPWLEMISVQQWNRLMWSAIKSLTFCRKWQQSDIKNSSNFLRQSHSNAERLCARSGREETYCSMSTYQWHARVQSWQMIDRQVTVYTQHTLVGGSNVSMGAFLVATKNVKWHFYVDDCLRSSFKSVKVTRNELSIKFKLFFIHGLKTIFK